MKMKMDDVDWGCCARGGEDMLFSNVSLNILGLLALEVSFSIFVNESGLVRVNIFIQHSVLSEFETVGSSLLLLQ